MNQATLSPKNESPYTKVDTLFTTPKGVTLHAVWSADIETPNYARVRLALRSFLRRDSPQEGDLVCLACNMETHPNHHQDYCPLLRLVKGKSPRLQPMGPSRLSFTQDLTWFGSARRKGVPDPLSVSVVLRLSYPKETIVLHSVSRSFIAFGDCASVFLRGVDLSQLDIPRRLSRRRLLMGKSEVLELKGDAIVSQSTPFPSGPLHLPFVKHFARASMSYGFSKIVLVLGFSLLAVPAYLFSSHPAFIVGILLVACLTWLAWWFLNQLGNHLPPYTCWDVRIVCLTEDQWKEAFPKLPKALTLILPVSSSREELGFSFVKTDEPIGSATHGHTLCWSPK